MAQVCRGQSRLEARIPRKVRKINMTLMDALDVAFRRSPPCIAAGFSSSTNRNGAMRKITSWNRQGKKLWRKIKRCESKRGGGPTIFLKLKMFFLK